MAGVLFASCRKKPDTPPFGTTTFTDIATLRSQYAAAKPNGGVYKLTTNVSLNLTVTMDESSGNIHKLVYAKDNTGAIAIRLTASGGLHQGDYIHLNLRNVAVDLSGGTLQLDSLNTDSSVVKETTGNVVTPIVISSLQSLLTNTTNFAATYESQLVTLTNVQFASNNVDSMYASLSGSGTNRYLESCYSSSPLTTFTETFNSAINKSNFASGGKQLEIYTNSHANFAGSHYTIPAGSGSITGILTQYGGDIQFTIRSLADINLNQPRYPGWTNAVTKGPYVWQGFTSQPGSATNPCLDISTPYSSTCSCNFAPEDAWLITPKLSDPTGKKLDFKNACRYNANSNYLLTVFASADFDGANIKAATWKQIHCEGYISNSNSSSPPNFFSAQNILLDTLSNLKNYTGGYYLAFRYRCNTTDSVGTYYLDDVIIHP